MKTKIYPVLEKQWYKNPRHWIISYTPVMVTAFHHGHSPIRLKRLLI
jgi:hypothetical protein